VDEPCHKPGEKDATGAAFPDHHDQLDALSRIEGQVRGIKGMVVEQRYCVDILIQIRAVHAALRRVERNILQSYLQTCVQHTFSDGSTDEREEKVREILSLFDWENGKPR
jgi:DNA-binding FrmR family transcriptional regulator